MAVMGLLTFNLNGSNSSGWSGLPGGFRDSGGYSSNGVVSYWWSASESGSDSWSRLLILYYDNFKRFNLAFQSLVSMGSWVVCLVLAMM
jgi:hypothetical protein